jgi:hypothetical protein
MAAGTKEETLARIERLRSVKRGHGCWGEPDDTYPSQDDLDLANFLERELNSKPSK